MTEDDVVAALRGRLEDALRELDAAYAREELLVEKLHQHAKKPSGGGAGRARRTARRQARRARRVLVFLLTDPRVRKFLRLSVRNPMWGMRTLQEKIDRRRRSRGAR